MLILAAVALPAASDTPDGHADHPFNWSDFFGWVVNSTLLFGGLIVLLRKPLIKFLSQKSIDVKADIIGREKELDTMAGQFEEIRGRLGKLEEEVNRIREVARTEGDEEKGRIEKLGEKESQRILALTEAEINNRVESSVAKLKERIADLTIDHFKREFSAGLDGETQKKIVDRNIAISGKILGREGNSDSGSEES
jgi:F0F1-type ATP synthase membrane subunit b/b'